MALSAIQSWYKSDLAKKEAAAQKYYDQATALFNQMSSDKTITKTQLRVYENAVTAAGNDRDAILKASLDFDRTRTVPAAGLADYQTAHPDVQPDAFSPSQPNGLNPTGGTGGSYGDAINYGGAGFDSSSPMPNMLGGMGGSAMGGGGIPSSGVGLGGSIGGAGSGGGTLVGQNPQAGSMIPNSLGSSGVLGGSPSDWNAYYQQLSALSHSGDPVHTTPTPPTPTPQNESMVWNGTWTPEQAQKLQAAGFMLAPDGKSWIKGTPAQIAAAAAQPNSLQNFVDQLNSQSIDYNSLAHAASGSGMSLGDFQNLIGGVLGGPSTGSGQGTTGGATSGGTAGGTTTHPTGPTITPQPLNSLAPYGDLLKQYADAYNTAKTSNEQRYADINAGYSQIVQHAGDSLNAINQSRTQDINDAYVRQRADAEQGLVSRGMDNTTVRQSVLEGLGSQQQRDLNNLAGQMGQLQLTYPAKYQEDQLGFMERRADTYPDMALLTNLYQQLGQGGVTADQIAPAVNAVAQSQGLAGLNPQVLAQLQQQAASGAGTGAQQSAAQQNLLNAYQQGAGGWYGLPATQQPPATQPAATTPAHQAYTPLPPTPQQPAAPITGQVPWGAYPGVQPTPQAPLAQQPPMAAPYAPAHPLQQLPQYYQYQPSRLGASPFVAI